MRGLPKSPGIAGAPSCRSGHSGVPRCASCGGPPESGAPSCRSSEGNVARSQPLPEPPDSGGTQPPFQPQQGAPVAPPAGPPGTAGRPNCRPRTCRLIPRPRMGVGVRGLPGRFWLAVTCRGYASCQPTARISAGSLYRELATTPFGDDNQAGSHIRLRHAASLGFSCRALVPDRSCRSGTWDASVSGSARGVQLCCDLPGPPPCVA
jgi:hypothetical protein